MDSKVIKKGIVLAALTGAVLIPSEQAFAAEKSGILKVSKTQMESVLSIDYLSKPVFKIEPYIEEAKGAYYDMAFAQVEDGSYLYVRSAISEESEWVGKLYNEGAATITEKNGDWVRIESASVSGYVKVESLVIEKAADLKAKEILSAKNPGVDIELLDEETVKNSFSYAESKEEELSRMEREDAERRQGVVDFAVQFVGNPYKWGGASLTNGADCSGFVKSVYANYGIGLPHSSRAMRNVGTEVSYENVKPGDIICYEGHVGIYAGNGKIVNAIDDDHGIGMSSATYKDIITVRRLI